MAENSKNGTIGYSMATVLTILGMAVGAVGSFYGARDQARAEARLELQAAGVQIRSDVHEELAHYVSREEFAQWKESNGARRDSQYWELLNALQRISARLQK